MSESMLDAMARGGHEEVHALSDGASGLRAFLVLHDTRLGPAFGGVRRFAYDDEQRALQDGLRLARAMSRKCALAGLQAGGGKIVLLDRDGLDARAAYERIGEAVERLAGRLYTGPDVGTAERELAWLAARTSYVTRPGADGPGLLAESTGEGVIRAMEAALRHLDGAVDWPRRTVVVQGLGKVGAYLARRLVQAGARVKAAEIKPGKEDLARELDVELLPDCDEFYEPCDVFAPCAMGGILHDLTIPRLRCRIVAGAANNVLARTSHGDRLAERGILFVPDVVSNSGALQRGWHFHVEGRRVAPAEIGARIGAACERILDLAVESGTAPERVAVAEADRILDGRGDDAVKERPAACGVLGIAAPNP